MAGAAKRPASRRHEAALRARYEAALALHRQGDLAGAEALYRQILAQMPASFHALHMLGVLCGQRDDWAQSAQLLARAVEVDPGVAAAHANLGNTLRLLGRFDEAMRCYEAALRLQPGNSRALKGRGLILWKQQRCEEALACYEQLLRLEPAYVDGWIMRGAALDQLGRPDESAASYRKALEFDNATDPEKIRYLLAVLGSEPLPAASPLEYVRGLFDRYAARFDEHLVGKLRYRVPQLLVEQLRPSLRDGAALDVLDLGCGTGLCGTLLRPWARSLTGLDLSEKMLVEARGKNVYDRLVAGEAATWLATQHAAFDLIVAADVLIYIGDLSAVFDGALQALRPGGLFALSTEAANDGEAGVSLGPSLRFAHAESHLRAQAGRGAWRIESLTTQTLREEDGHSVEGHLAVFRRPAVAPA